MKENTKKRLIFYKVIFAIIAIITILVATLMIFKYKQRQENEEKNKEILQELNNNIQQENATISIDGVKVIGSIKIPKINLEYPILEETTKHTMNLSITKFCGGNINDYGNLALAGHNNRDGTMFGRTKELEISDEIELTGLNKVSITYSIVEIFITDPNDVSILTTKDGKIREVTLITCSNGNKERLVIKAIEKNN